MRKTILMIIVAALLVLVGCDNVMTQSPAVTSSGIQSGASPVNTSGGQSNNSSGSESSYVETYTDESHKQIQYGKLSFDIGEFHVVSRKRSDNTETFECEIDKGKTRPQTRMSVKIQEIEKMDFADIQTIASYLKEMSPNYERIRIYDNVTDDSGITGLYSVTGKELTKYIVCYGDVCYLIESDYDILEVYLFKGDPDANHQADKYKIECADSFVADVNEITYYNKDGSEKVEYDITQGKDGIKYSAGLNYDKEKYMSEFVLKNEEGKKLLELSVSSAFDKSAIIKFLDLNRDGYVDIQFLETEGTMNNIYALYVWDDSQKNFVQVKCDEMLSAIEAYDGYLMNWQKAGADSGIVQKLVWKDKFTLVKESEEAYQAE